MIAFAIALTVVGLAAVLAARNVALRWLAVVHGHKRADDVAEVATKTIAFMDNVEGEFTRLHARIDELAANTTAAEALRKVKELSAKAAFGGPRR